MSINHRQYVADALSLSGDVEDTRISVRDREILARYLAGESADVIGADCGISGERVKDVCGRIAKRATGCGWLLYRQCASAEEGMRLLRSRRARHQLLPGQAER
jgi:hypothetical protein